MEFEVQYRLDMMYKYLMFKTFPYHSVSVVHRHQDTGFHVIFMKSVEYMVTDEIKLYLKQGGFSYSYIDKS